VSDSAQNRLVSGDSSTWILIVSPEAPPVVLHDRTHPSTDYPPFGVHYGFVPVHSFIEKDARSARVANATATRNQHHVRRLEPR
jgi:hypothetical protein